MPIRHQNLQMASARDARYGQKISSNQNFDYMFTLLITGHGSVGKTSFPFCYMDDSFTSAFVSTAGIDFKVKTVFKMKRIKLQIQDKAGQERYRTITTAYYHGAMGFILMYDTTNEESFNTMQDWPTQIKTYSWDNAQQVVSTKRSQHLGEQLGFELLQTSAKGNINVKQIFEHLVDIICDKMSESLEKDPAITIAKHNMRLTESPPLPQPSCDC
uniref:small monomeric GTPase n=1 Tax=Catagonus wagneri TaxID=51154 RepID=A0A8C3X971_9CETA